jgi:ABC-type sugar transport system ATPase subunit
MIYVTHDQVEAMTLADRIVVMNKGCIGQIGTPMDLHHSPANRFVAGFIGSPSMNVFDAEVRGRANGELLLHTAGGGDIVARRAVPIAGDRVTLGIRPGYVEFGDGMAAGNLATGTVQIVELSTATRCSTSTYPATRWSCAGRAISRTSTPASR